MDIKHPSGETQGNALSPLRLMYPDVFNFNQQQRGWLALVKFGAINDGILISRDL